MPNPSIGNNTKDTEEKLQTIINHIQDIIIESDLNGVFTYVSPQAYNILGYKPDEVVGLNGFKFIHPEDLSNVDSRMKNLVGTGGPISVEYRALHKDGHYVHISAKGSIVKENDGFKLIAVLRDVSLQKEFEQKIKESEQKYRMITNNAQDIVYTLDMNLNNTFISPSISVVLGYEVDEAMLMQPRDSTHKDDLDRIARIYKEEFEIEQESHVEKDLNRKRVFNVREKHKDGRFLIIEHTISWLRDENGIAAGIIGVARDVTHLKEVELKLHEQKKELEQLNNLKTEFLRRASHELKTPLIVIKGNAEIVTKLHREGLKPKVIKFIEEIKKGCNRLEDIIHKLIESSKLESSKIELNATKEDLSTLIKLCINEVQMLVKIKGLKINLDVEDSVTTKFDKDQIREVILNLLSNAINYSQPNEIIDINSEIKNNTITISIKDRGIGITSDEKIQLFQKFGKITRDNQESLVVSEGSGLGLYISKKIVELHGGEIWIESEGRNKGSTFYFSLPIV